MCVDLVIYQESQQDARSKNYKMPTFVNNIPDMLNFCK